ncbi:MULTISPECIES: DoxX-like family protein [Comamonas]|uniref:Epimerase n=1 Tax=Comamonas testosteroni TaxID=285 RepID=A0A096FPH6_COMTE|nr:MULTISPECIES: DoxX-like family protein [Comamonas]KGH31658.1 epimerase [Comamonas testosteroni]MPT13133.1 epimerase [Comamonas sp.]
MPELQNGSRANPHKQAARFMHASLVVVWLGTAVVSALDYLGLSGLNHEGARLLDQGGIDDARWQALLIWSGLLADLALGLALLLRPGRAIYLSALLLMTAMTVIGTALQPTLWLHPLGPLLKNLPIAAMLWFLLQTDSSSNRLES